DEALRKIAPPLQLGRESVLRQRRGQDALSFVKHEEEGPVATVVQLRDVDRPAGAGAKLVALETCQRAAGAVGEKVIGVEEAVAQELEYAAVQIVGSGFRDQRDHPSTAASVLGGIGVGLNLEFLNPFH